MMEDRLRRAAEVARGFMPADEGLALYRAAASLDVDGPLLEVGSYCGKSAVYLGAAAQRAGRVLFCVDHHRGSEENQPGWEHHDPEVVDAELGVIDTLPFFRRTIRDAGLEETVVSMVGDSPTVASLWATPLAMVFHRRRPRRRAGPPRLRGVVAPRGTGRAAGHPRCVRGPR